MTTRVTHGADTDQLRQIADQLTALAEQADTLQATGSTQMEVLVEAWAGTDTDVFAGDWLVASGQLAGTSQRMRAYAKLLHEQAEQQDDASGGGGFQGSSSTPPPDKGDDRGPGGLPKSVTDLMDNLFSKPDNPWPDLTMASRFPPTGIGPLDWWKEKKRELSRWGIVMPDLTPGNVTDWANDQWKEHVGNSKWVKKAREGLDSTADVMDVASMALNPFMNVAPAAAAKIGLNVASDELRTASDILKDPKGWWTNDASTLDKIGIIAAPVGGLAGKVAVKTTKEAYDLIANGLKHGDDVKTPHVTPKDAPDDVDSPRTDQDAHDSGNPNKNDSPGGDSIEGLEDAVKNPAPDDAYSEHRATVSQKALDILEERGVTDLDRVWDEVPPTSRGRVLEATEGGNLPQSFPVIDRVDSTVEGLDVTSIKSLDPEAKTYLQGNKFEGKVNGYVDSVADFKDADFDGVTIDARDINGRTLDLIVRPDSMTSAQSEALQRATERAESKGVKLVVKERP